MLILRRVEGPVSAHNRSCGNQAGIPPRDSQTQKTAQPKR